MDALLPSSLLTRIILRSWRIHMKISTKNEGFIIRKRSLKLKFSSLKHFSLMLFSYCRIGWPLLTNWNCKFDASNLKWWKIIESQNSNVFSGSIGPTCIITFSYSISKSCFYVLNIGKAETRTKAFWFYSSWNMMAVRYFLSPVLSVSVYSNVLFS